METQAFSTWGAWGSSGPKEAAALPVEFGADRPLKAFLGWEGLFINSPEVNVVDLARAFAAKAAEASCGFCSPCREGFARIASIIAGICAGEGQEGDLAEIEALATLIKDSSRCDIGLTSPRPLLDLLAQKREAFEQAIASGEPIEPGEYVATVTAPCKNACPSHLDIPAYVEMIANGRYDESLDIILKDCALPGVTGRVCVRPCESACRRALMDEGIAIKSLKRFAADQALKRRKGFKPRQIEFKNEKVAIVGAGPAGLAAAFYLGQLGYHSTIFEAMDEPGGMAAVGIPDYRLPRSILRGEADIVKKVGAEIHYGVNIGEDMKVEELAKKGYKAVFVGVGAPEASRMRCEGEDEGYDCFMTGIDFLKKTAFGQKPIEGKRLLVIGGGNVAMDCVRSALRQGFTDVNLVYRRTQAEMPADPVEIEEAMEEGVKFHFLVAPTKVLADDNNKVTGLEVMTMELGEPDASGRRRPVPVEGSEHVIETDAIIPAIGQVCVVDCVLPGAELTRWKTLIVDELTFQSKDLSVFGGGDDVTGPNTLIAALAAGKKAAKYIAAYLAGGKETAKTPLAPMDEELMEALVSKLGVFDPDEAMLVKGATAKMHLECLPPEERVKSFAEVEASPTVSMARHEAERCLRCYRIALAAV